MPITTSATINLQFAYNQTDTGDGIAQTRDIAEVNYVRSLSNTNSGNTGVISQIWNDQIFIGSGLTHIIDLHNLTRPILNGTLSLSYNSGNIKSIFFDNLANVSGVSGTHLADVLIRSTGANAFTAPFGGGSGNVPLLAYNSYMMMNSVSGFRVVNDQRFIALVDQGKSTNVNVLIIGEKATGA